MSIDSILMIGFGGPTSTACERHEQCPYEDAAECFVAGVLGDDPKRVDRAQEIAKHYRHFGGFSAYNTLTEQQASALSQSLQKDGTGIPVYVCYRHWVPWALDVLRDMAAKGHKKIGLLIMAPHQCVVSWDWYINAAQSAAQELLDEMGAEHAPTIEVICEPWWKDAGFISANVAQLNILTSDWSDERKGDATLIFTAHSVPCSILEGSDYETQYAETAALIAQEFGHTEYELAYQSAASPSPIPWCGPDILEKIDELAAAGCKEIIIQAAGFLVDHVEVLYDLDVEAQERAQQHGISYNRATCVHADANFIATLRKAVETAVV